MTETNLPAKETAPQPAPKGPQVDIRTKISRMEKAYAQLIAITAVDLGDGSFELIYSFFSKSELVNLRFTVQDGYEIDSIADMFPGARNLEREIIDLFGLRFKGVEGGLMIMPSSNIIAPLRKTSTPETPRSRAQKGVANADH
jgi:NADH:ubiquinone oxidoreductase subunit C